MRAKGSEDTFTMERNKCPAAAASSDALGEYISEFVMDVVKLNAAARNPTNYSSTSTTRETKRKGECTATR